MSSQIKPRTLGIIILLETFVEKYFHAQHGSTATVVFLTAPGEVSWLLL